MNVMFLLIGCSLVIAISFLLMFLWSVRSGQYEDTYTPSVRMLFEEEKQPVVTVLFPEPHEEIHVKEEPEFKAPEETESIKTP